MSPVGARTPGASAKAPRLMAEDGWLGLAAPAVVFLGLALYGGMLPQTALGLICIWAGLIGICLMRPRLRADIVRLDGLGLAAAAFSVVIVVGLWSLTPYVPGGPHPVWAYLGISPGAATVDKSQTQLELVKLMGLACVFVVGAATGGSDGRARLALNTTLLVGAAYAAWAFFEFVATRETGSSRLQASVRSANTAGTILAMLFVLAMGPLASRLRTDSRRRMTDAAPYAIAAVLFLVCLFMTASRGAFVAAAAGLAVVIGLHILGGRVRLSRGLLVGGGAVAAIVTLLALSGEFLVDRMLGAGDDTVASRAIIAQVHWDAFEKSPWMGYGLGSFDAVNRMLLDSGHFMQVWSVRAAHNVYLGWLEQGGLLGALPMFACMASLILVTARKSMLRSRSVSLLFALLGVDAVVLVHGATDFALELFAVAALWSYLLGLQFALAQGSSAR